MSLLVRKEAKAVIIFNIFLILVLLGYLFIFGKLASKYTMYFFVAPIFLFLLFKLKKPVYKIAGPLFVLIFVENIIISRVPLTSFFKVGICFIFGAVVFFSILWNQKSQHFPKYFPLAFALLILTSIISIIIGSADGIVFLNANIEDFITYYLGFLMFIFIGYNVYQNPDDLVKVVSILFLFGALTAAGQIFSILTGKNLELLRGAEMVQEGKDLSQGQWRYGGFFGNVNTMSAFFVMLIPAGLLLTFHEKKIWLKIIYVFIILSMILSILMGASRGALLFVAANLLISLFFIKLDIKKLIGGFVALIIIIVVSNALFDEFLQDFVSRAFEEMSKKGTDSPREMIWAHTVDIIFDYPLGVGLFFYNYTLILIAYGNMSWANPHNMYLHFLINNGFLGLIVMLFIFGKTIFLNIKRFISSKDENVRLCMGFLTLILTGFLLMGITEPLFRNQYKINYIIGAVVGLSLALSHRFKEDLNKNNNVEFDFDESKNEN